MKNGFSLLSDAIFNGDATQISAFGLYQKIMCRQKKQRKGIF